MGDVFENISFASNVSSNGTYSAPYSIPTTISIIVLSLTASIITASGNILVIASFCFYRNLRTINNYLILNLAIADLIIGVYSMNVYTIYVIQVRPGSRRILKIHFENRGIHPWPGISINPDR